MLVLLGITAFSFYFNLIHELDLVSFVKHWIHGVAT